MNECISVLLVDDHPLVRAGFQRMLAADSHIVIKGEADNAKSACEMYNTLHPDVVIMDLNMPSGMNGCDDSATHNAGLEAIRRILAHDNQARVLVLSATDSAPFPSQVISAGARGYLTKRCAGDELLKAVRKVFSGEQYLADGLEGINEESPLTSLTKREFQIFSLLAEGKSVSHIAEAMYLSPKTVHAHRANLFRKLNIKSNAELIHIAIRLGIVET
ncbi:response regulator transcription factor [Neptuniibacter sp. CAU 1671]|uniref:response regulator n=1 Tax=Neptuniibacter sp. CAU 1671 TaxID=3032593 RepID=UPI0023DBC5B0|nr:response regulator transcription factor [Neptuniibacter sp. CAU 1671]MDF2180524.1 response regulator transcription factor [Neptuniibacter sp. CAU 1671]